MLSHHHRVGVTLLLITISAESLTLVLETSVKPSRARYIYLVVPTITYLKSLVNYETGIRINGIKPILPDQSCPYI